MKTAPLASIASAAGADSPGRKGFTLVEVLVAMSIITISAMAILPLVWATMDDNNAVQLKGRAKEVAVQKMEELTSLPEEAIVKYIGLGTTYTSPVEYLTEDGSLTSDTSAVFKRTFNITQVPGLTVDPKPVIYTCVVQYSYKGKVRSCSFTTMGSF